MHWSAELEAFQPQHGHPYTARLNFCQRKLHAAAPITALPGHQSRLPLRMSPCASWTSLAGMLIPGLAGHRCMAAAEHAASPNLAATLLQPLQRRLAASPGCSCACVLVPGQPHLMCPLPDRQPSLVSWQAHEITAPTNAAGHPDRPASGTQGPARGRKHRLNMCERPKNVTETSPLTQLWWCHVIQHAVSAGRPLRRTASKQGKRPGLQSA